MNLDRLIQDIRRQTGTQLDEDDPIIAAAVINEHMLDRALADLRKMMATAGDNWAAQSAHNEASARKAASEVIGNATDWVDARFKETAASLSAEVVGTIRVELEKVARLTRIATRAAWLSSASAAVSAAVAIGLVASLI